VQRVIMVKRNGVLGIPALALLEEGRSWRIC